MCLLFTNCDSGTFGQNCTESCGKCLKKEKFNCNETCQSNCSGNVSCDPITGICPQVKIYTFQRYNTYITHHF